MAVILLRLSAAVVLLLVITTQVIELAVHGSTRGGNIVVCVSECVGAVVALVVVAPEK